MTRPPGGFGRRDFGLLAGLLVPGCAALPGDASAQPQRPQQQPRRGAAAKEIITAPAMPCADARGDLCGMLLEGSGAPAGTVVVFGQSFRPGDVPRGGRVAARLAESGQALPVQLDVSRRHPDGSARFGVVSLAAPAVPQGRRVGVVLARRDEGAEAPLDLGLFDGRRVEVEITPRDGTPWRADLLALLRAQPAASRWQSGPLAVQGRIEARVPMGEVTSLRLVCDLALRGDRSIWADLWLRNDIAMQPGGGDTHYAVRLLIDGRAALDQTIERHWQYGAWGRLVGGQQGRAAAEPARVLHDPGYLAASAAVMPYDLSLGVDAAILERPAQQMQQPAWNEPFNPRGLMVRMGAPGARPDLGVTTNWQAAWIVTGDARAAAYAIGQAEAAGGVPWHFWDMNGGAEGRGGWLDVRRFPRFWSDPRGGQPPRTLLQAAPINSPWQRGGAPSHQPSFSFVPYLLTGRRPFLDNLTAQAAWNITIIWPSPRNVPGATGDLVDACITNNRQVRSAAWSMRTMDEATWIAGDSDPNLPYLEGVNAANWAWLRGRIPEMTQIQGELHGYIEPTGFGYGTGLAPWQQDYFASTAANAARRGREDAKAFLDFMRNFIVGRFYAADKGFPRNDAVAYRLTIIPNPPDRSAPPKPPLDTWAEVARATREAGDSNGDGWNASVGEYGRLGMLSLALVAHVFNDERAKEAWRWMANSDSQYVRPVVFERTPYHSVAPPGLNREPGKAPRCTASTRPRAG